MKSSTILVVDDEITYLKLLESLLFQEGYTNIITEGNPLNVFPILEKYEVDLIILDIYMPHLDGLLLLEKLADSYPTVPVIMVTAVDEIDIALKAIKIGAYEFITKPPEIDRLLLTITRALEAKLITKERDTLREISAGDKKKIEFKDIVTESPLMHKVFELVEIFAPTNETVLIVGETGTGKDLIAKKIHDISPRKYQPFVSVNLASISSSLFESELFGYEKGAFTGASTEKIGYFEAANGGTIYLDEIGELNKDLQGKLLRVIQYNEIYRLGNSKPVKLDIRIIAATNKELFESVKKHEFRADLFYRLNRGFIKLPSLRMRGNDIRLLADYFMKIGCKIYKKNIAGFTNEIEEALLRYHFPGNVRELENIVLNAVAKCKNGDNIDSIELPQNYVLEKTPSSDLTIGDIFPLEEAINNHIRSVLQRTDGNTTKAAALLGISERTLQRKLKKIKGDTIR